MTSSRTGIAFAAGLALAGPAFADPPARSAPVAAPVFTWTGLYAGLNVGYGFRGDGGDGSRLVVRVPDATNHPVGGGFVGGGQAGYDYQFTPGSGVVIGVEADVTAGLGRARNRSDTAPGSRPAAGATVLDRSGDTGPDVFATVRGRLGYAFDRTLVYGTAGFAYGTGGATPGSANPGIDDVRTGFAVGGGIAYALPAESFLNFFRSSAVTVKVEGLFVGLDGADRHTFDRDADGGRREARPDTGPGRGGAQFAIVRGGLNYRFGSY